MRAVMLLLAGVFVLGCGDGTTVYPSPPSEVDGGTPDAPSGIDGQTTAGDECVSSYDCLLDTVCRDGYCVRVECLPNADVYLCDPDVGDLCAREGLAYDEDADFVCTQWLGCPGGQWVDCDGPRPYCNGPVDIGFGVVLYCPDPTTRWWATVSEYWDCTENEAPCDPGEGE